MLQNTDDLRIQSLKPLISPAILLEQLPITEPISATVSSARQQAIDILQGKDPRVLVVVGPCSIHDPAAAIDYATKLHHVAQQLSDELHILMRVYFEKPRTTIGWKGLINDPDLDDSFKINVGLHAARKLLLDINALGLGAATEFLDTITPQFISDLIAWGAIGARTTESQIHRELASGLSMPVGFKNGTTGDIQIAIDAIGAAAHPHHFLGVTKDGIPAIVATRGNQDCHIILRGSKQGPNYDGDNIAKTSAVLQSNDLPAAVMVDCSHGNSNKDYTRQALVVTSLRNQLKQGNRAIRGVMLESNLKAGSQALRAGQSLTYGQSITDACVGWEETVLLLRQLALGVQARFNNKEPLKAHDKT